MVPGRSKVAGEVVGPPGCNRSAELWESGGGGREVVRGRPEVRAEVSPLQLGRSATTPLPTPLTQPNLNLLSDPICNPRGFQNAKRGSSLELAFRSLGN